MEINYEENSIKNIDSVKKLYLNSFPEDERRDFNELLNLLNRKDIPFNLLSVYSGKEFAGFISYWKWDDVIYIEHFAIEPAMRGGGIGQKVLLYLIQKESIPFLLEVDPPNDEISIRRIDFYKRCGFHLHEDVYYEQPPYDASKKSVRLILMTSPYISLYQDDLIIRRMKKEVYNWKIDD